MVVSGTPAPQGFMPAKFWLGTDPVGKIFVFMNEYEFIYALVNKRDPGDTDYIVCTCYTEKKPNGYEAKIHYSRPLYPISKQTFNVFKGLGWPSDPKIVRTMVKFVAGGKA